MASNSTDKDNNQTPDAPDELTLAIRHNNKEVFNMAIDEAIKILDNNYYNDDEYRFAQKIISKIEQLKQV